MSAPICRRCGTTAVKRDAGIVAPIPYWYCTKCKIEINRSLSEQIVDLVESRKKFHEENQPRTIPSSMEFYSEHVLREFENELERLINNLDMPSYRVELQIEPHPTFFDLDLDPNHDIIKA